MKPAVWAPSLHGDAFVWTAPSGRIWRVVRIQNRNVNAMCDGILLQTEGRQRTAWWRSFSSATFECEFREGRLAAIEQEKARRVQTSAPTAPEVIYLPGDVTEERPAVAVTAKGAARVFDAEERFAFRVGQALASEQMGSIDGARRWLLDAISALDEMQQAELTAKKAAT